MKLLTLDIETRPHLGYVWGLWDQNVGLSQIAQVGSVICWAAKWYGRSKVEFRSDFHDGHEAMIARAAELYDEADAVITFNGKNFDNKHLRREWLLAGLNPPSQHVDIDLLPVVRKQFKFASNKLQHVATDLGLGGKVQHDGFDLWVRCMANDERAWATMRRYCKGDVTLTEKVYDRLLPWITPHPHRGLYGGDKDACPRCGKDDSIVRKNRPTPQGQFIQRQCKACGGYWSLTRAVDRVGSKAC